MDFAGRFFKGDRVVWIIFMFLCVVSVLEVFSSASSLTYKSQDHWGPITVHGGFLIVGTILVFIVHKMNYNFFQKLDKVLILLSVALLAYVIVGGGSVNDASRWIKVLGFTFQPSEIAKMGVIISVSSILSKFQEGEMDSKKAFKQILIVATIICVLIVGENFSTAVLLFGVVFLMMLVGGLEKKKLLLLAISLILLAIVILFLPIRRSETWRNRILDKIESRTQVPPEKYDIDENMQVAHANIAIATSGFIGKMPGNSVQRDFLPQAFSDFIYAIIIEELGLLGGIGVLLLYLLLLMRVGKIAYKCERTFPAFLVIGIALLLVSQAFINMAVAVGLIPVTGQPLPLISKGGTSTLINCIYIGIILSVSRYTARLDELKAQNVSDDQLQTIIEEEFDSLEDEPAEEVEVEVEEALVTEPNTKAEA